MAAPAALPPLHPGEPAAGASARRRLLEDGAFSRSGHHATVGSTGPTGVLDAARLRAYAGAVLTAYFFFLAVLLWKKAWIVGPRGLPLYNDFACDFVAGLLALHGEAAAIYDPRAFVSAQQTFVGAHPYVSPIWPYPPSFLLLLAPLAALPYAAAFLAWAGATLAACVAVIARIVGRPLAALLALASPFAAINFLGGQSGAMTAALIGGALWTLESRPVLAGILVGCLGYKPQFAILFPVALAAARQWRACAAAAATTILLAAVSTAVFGVAPWLLFPQKLAAQAQMNLVVGPGPNGDLAVWGLVQTMYGLVRRLGGGSVLAASVQAVTTTGLAVLVWLLWRSRTRFALKAAALSAAVLAATPYAFSYSLAAVAVPVAFLARDRTEHGAMPGEKALLVALTAAGFLVLASWGKAPIGAPIVLALLGIILRRVFSEAAAGPVR